MQARTPWLADTEPAAGLTALRDNSQVAFLANDGQTGIGRRFVDLIPERPVTRLIVISPYWDHGLTALKYLMTQLAPQETILLIGPKKRLFPVDALKDLPGLRLMDISVLDPTRFFHAKAIIAQTAQADHVLFGSANCTNAALGTASSPGINEEACLYRRLPPHFSILVLSIEKLLTNEREVDRSTLEPPKLDDDINLSSLSRRDPGRFECVYDTLIWWPGQNTADDSVIELLDAERNELPGLLAPVHWQPPARRFRLPVLKDRPALARLRYADGTKSTPAIVTLADALKQSARESRNKKVEGVASLLADETNEGFWLLEALDVLEAAEDRQTDEAKTITRSRRGGDKPEPPREQYRTLNYENFIAGRQLRSDASAMVPSSLAGSELSLVRGFLKRILGVGRPDETPPDMTTEEDLSGTFDMGDETADAQGAIEGGEEFKTSPPEKAKDEDDEKEKEAQRRERRKIHAEQIIAAIDSFDERIRKRAAVGELSAIDVLRLRALIMVAAAAGHGGTRSATDHRRSTMQAFPATGDVNTWPRLLGRVLFIFFGGNKPAICSLHVDASFDELTADIKESWAACFWTIQACLEGARKRRGNADLVKSLESLAQRLYAITNLQNTELTGPETTGVIGAMNERYAKRLGIDAVAIEKAHFSEAAKFTAAR